MTMQQAADRLAKLLDGLPADQPLTVAHLRVVVAGIGTLLTEHANELNRTVAKHDEAVAASQRELAESWRAAAREIGLGSEPAQPKADDSQ